MAAASWDDGPPRQPYESDTDPRPFPVIEPEPRSVNERGPALGMPSGVEPDTRPLHLEPLPPMSDEDEPGPDHAPGRYHSRDRAPGGRDVTTAGPGSRSREPSRRAARSWGTRSARAGILFVIGCAAAGAALTVATRREPGAVLGAFVVAGTLIGALSVRPRAVHVIIPVPALAYLAAALAAGIIHDRATETTRTAVITSVTQWFAGGFFAMAAATALAIAITAARRRRAR